MAIKNVQSKPLSEINRYIKIINMFDKKNEKSCRWWRNVQTTNRSNHRRCFVRKGVLRNFAKFTGKHLCQSLFFNKASGPRPATLLKGTLAQVFSCEFYKISKRTFFTEHLREYASVQNSDNNTMISILQLDDELSKIWEHSRANAYTDETKKLLKIQSSK